MLMSGFQRAQTIRDAISGRRSIRQYSSDDVSPDTVRRLIGMAVMAPSAHNRQPWRFVVIRDADIKLRLADAMGVRLKNDRTRDGDDPAAIQRDVARSHLRISEAPVLLAVCLTMEDMDRYPDERRNRAEFLIARDDHAPRRRRRGHGLRLPDVERSHRHPQGHRGALSLLRNR
jgi:nitroreductase